MNTDTKRAWQIAFIIAVCATGWLWWWWIRMPPTSTPIRIIGTPGLIVRIEGTERRPCRHVDGRYESLDGRAWVGHVICGGGA